MSDLNGEPKLRRLFPAISVLLAITVAACGTSTSSAGPSGSGQVLGATAVATPSLTASSTPSPTPTDSPSPSPSVETSLAGTPGTTTLDPCALFTTADATALTGASYGAGVPGTSAGARLCMYINLSAHATVSLTIRQAATPAEAQAAYAAAVAVAPGTLTKLVGYGDDATIARYGQTGISMSSIYVLTGSIFFLISPITGGTGPTDVALKIAAMAVLGRLHDATPNGTSLYPFAVRSTLD
jgi:hypothetical protein